MFFNKTIESKSFFNKRIISRFYNKCFDFDSKSKYFFRLIMPLHCIRKEKENKLIKIRKDIKTRKVQLKQV